MSRNCRHPRTSICCKAFHADAGTRTSVSHDILLLVLAAHRGRRSRCLLSDKLYIPNKRVGCSWWRRAGKIRWRAVAKAIFAQENVQDFESGLASSGSRASRPTWVERIRGPSRLGTKYLLFQLLIYKNPRPEPPPLVDFGPGLERVQGRQGLHTPHVSRADFHAGRVASESGLRTTTATRTTAATPACGLRRGALDPSTENKGEEGREREKISKLLSSYGGAGLLLFDFMEIADCCQAKKVHFIYDLRNHPRQSLLQPNFGDFQGPALLVVFEDTSLTTEEICALHSAPPVKLHGQACRYGCGLLAAYRFTDLLSIVSSGCLYLFDPSGQIISQNLAGPKHEAAQNPLGKAFSLLGTGLPERFRDQFSAFEINSKLSWDSTGVTIFRLPLRLDTQETFKLGRLDVSDLFDQFKNYAPASLLFLRSLEAVTLSEWTEAEPLHEKFSVSISSSSANLRHHFQENKWRKFQLSNLFGGSNPTTKTNTMHVFIENDGVKTVSKWLVSQTLGSGCTRDMALDRRYLHYDLRPVAGVAACITSDVNNPDSSLSSCLLSPLPVSLGIPLPVTVFGNFLPIFEAGSRRILDEALGDFQVKPGLIGSHTGPQLSDGIIRATWNRHLLSCVLDSYLELIQELQRLYQGNSYAFWPTSRNLQLPAVSDALSLVKWLIKPLYTRLLELPVWQLHTGSFLRFNEGVFIAPPGQGVPVKPAVSTFLRAHYRVFTVPWELGKEAEEVGASIKELSPKALRSLMKVPSIAAAVLSVETQIDLLEYCCSDALFAEGSELNRDALTELKGVTCPTASVVMVKLGTSDLWVASKEQQELLPHLGQRFLHSLCLERPLLASLVLNKTFQAQMNLRPFSPQILAANLWTVLPKSWESSSRPWIRWEATPSEAWLRKLWQNIDVSSAEELSLFERWMLIPATNGSCRMLVSVARRNLVFVPPQAEEDDGTYDWLLPLLYKLNLPAFDSSFADCSVKSCCLSQQSLLPTVISKLVELKEAGGLQASPTALTSSDRDQLFGFLLKAPSALTQEEVSLLRSLPIYKNVRGDYVQIDADKSYIVAPEAFFQPDDENRFPSLPPSEGGAYYELLGVAQLRNSEILARYSLPRFSYLDAKEQENILRHLHDNWGSWRTDTALVDALKATKFVRSALSSSTNLFQPQELLDPENEILKQVFADERQRFPGGQFATPGWLAVLRAAGLRSIREPDLILDCAKKMEELGKRDLAPHQDLALLKSEIAGSLNVSDAVWSMATMLVEEVMNNLGSLYNSTFCGALSKIAFVPAEKGIPTMAGGSSNRLLVSYSEAVLAKDWPLAWTCCPVLTRSSIVPPEFSWAAFQLRSPPSISVVIKHLQLVGKNGGEDVLSRWPNAASSRPVEDVFGEVLQYLGNAWDGLSDFDKKELSLHAFIPVGNGTRLVTASALYTRLGMDLAPFVFEVPRAFLSHVNVLTALGMQYEPTATSMKQLLQGLQQSCGYQHLNPNELHAVMSIIHFIADDARSKSKIVPNAVVPDETSRLVSAAYCAYVDPAAAPFVSQIESSRLRLVYPGLSEDLCTVLGVKKLSDIVVEELDLEMPLEPVNSFGAYTESSIKERLRSSSFEQALWILLCEFQAQSTSKLTMSKESMQETVRFVADKLRFVTRLYTKFLLLPARKDITRYPEEDGARQRRLRAFYYLNRAKGVVLVAQPPEFISLPDLLTVVLSRLLGLPICLSLGPLFNVREDSDRVLRLVASGRGDRGLATSFSIGSILLPVHSKLLQFCPLRPFYSGEIVAWQLDGQKSGLRYGRVTEDIRAPAGHPLYRIRVETNPGNVQALSSSNVFSFKSTGGSSASPVEPASTASTTEAAADEESRPASSASSSRDASQEERPLQGMQATEYAQAISDILTSLGLPLSLEKQSLLEHTLTLQDQLSSANTLLLSEQVRADSTAKELEAAKSSWTCRVCFSSEVDSLLAPCGHVLCNGCCITLSRCPFCRTFISSKHRMYRP